MPFLTCTSKLGFTQFIDKPTTKNNILDLLFSTDPLIVSSFSVDCAFGTSDHATILFSLLLSNSHTVISNTDFSQSNSTDAYRPDFQQADYDAISNYFYNIDWLLVLSTHFTPNSIWRAFLSIIWAAISIFVPPRHFKPGLSGVKFKRKVYPRNIQRQLAMKRRLYKTIHFSAASLDRYKRAARRCHLLISCHQIAMEKKVIHSGNLGKFYKFVNRKLSCKSGVGPLRSSDGSIVVSDVDKASLLNEYLASVCTIDNGIIPTILSIE